MLRGCIGVLMVRKGDAYRNSSTLAPRKEFGCRFRWVIRTAELCIDVSMLVCLVLPTQPSDKRLMLETAAQTPITATARHSVCFLLTVSSECSFHDGSTVG